MGGCPIGELKTAFSSQYMIWEQWNTIFFIIFGLPIKPENKVVLSNLFYFLNFRSCHKFLETVGNLLFAMTTLNSYNKKTNCGSMSTPSPSVNSLIIPCIQTFVTILGAWLNPFFAGRVTVISLFFLLRSILTSGCFTDFHQLEAISKMGCQFSEKTTSRRVDEGLQHQGSVSQLAQQHDVLENGYFSGIIYG